MLAAEPVEVRYTWQRCVIDIVVSVEGGNLLKRGTFHKLLYNIKNLMQKQSLICPPITQRVISMMSSASVMRTKVYW